MTEERATQTATVSLAGEAPPPETASHFRAAIAAVQFLTRVPVGTSRMTTPAELAAAPGWFPLVGAFIGATTAGVLWLCLLLWPVWVAVPVALAVEAWLTGAFHEDALADFFDAFGGGWTRDDVLRILKDSRIGTFGTVALILGLAIRAAATMTIIGNCGAVNWGCWASAIVAAAAVGRWVVVFVMWLVPPIPERQSLARDVGVQIRNATLTLATVWGILGAATFAVLLPVHAIFAAGLLLPLVWYFTSNVQRVLGGITGDCLGCICYLAQLVVLLAAAASFRGGGL